MAGVLDSVNRIVWGVPALVLILGVGLYVSVWTGFIQIRLFPRALREFIRKMTTGSTSFRALCTALAATVGTGNLVGVAGAISLGGPGAIFWMWICAILGMATKYAEATLAVRFRILHHGEYTGGTMYMINMGMGDRWHWLAGIYSFFGVVAAFGVGNATQINAVIAGFNRLMIIYGGKCSSERDLAMGIVLAVIIGTMLFGGAKRIGLVAERLVPFMSGTYIVLCIGVLIFRADAVIPSLLAIIQGAFTPEAVTGGVIGSALQAVRIGVSRGVFTNEAGMGTASIAHAAAEVRHPAEQGMMGIMEVFLDTVVICTLTALVILCSGVEIPYGVDAGGTLTADAFCAVYGGWASGFLALAICCFAFATVLGWGLYGARCAQYLFGPQSWNLFAYMQIAVVVLGSVLRTGTVWSFAETVNGLMAIPNVIALVLLMPELRRLTIEYFNVCGSWAAGGTYENLDQCKPLPAFSHAKVSSLCGGSQATGKENLSSEYRSAGPSHSSGLSGGNPQL